MCGLLRLRVVFLVGREGGREEMGRVTDSSIVFGLSFLSSQSMSLFFLSFVHLEDE